jgi:hypothetical protein
MDKESDSLRRNRIEKTKQSPTSLSVLSVSVCRLKKKQVKVHRSKIFWIFLHVPGTRYAAICL